MNIAFCLFKYFPYGGLQRDFLRIATYCYNHGYKITVYTMSWQEYGEDKKNKNYIDYKEIFNIKIIPKKYKTNHYNNLYFSNYIEQDLKNNNIKYDLIIGFNKIANLDLYYCADSCYLARIDEQKKGIVKLLYKLSNRYKILKQLESMVFDNNKTKVLFLSEAEKNNYLKYYDFNQNNLYILPPNIDKNRFNINNYLNNNLYNKKDNKTKILLSVGSGFKTKGVDRSIRLIKYLVNNNIDNIKLIIIGQDNPSKFISLSKRLGVEHKVEFLSGRDNIAEYMSQAELLLHPAYRENTGTVILEAIIMGLPVVASEICGYSKYITKSRCGVVIPDKFNQDVYNNTVYNLLTNTDLFNMQQKGLEFRKKADIYNADKMILDIIQNKQ